MSFGACLLMNNLPIERSRKKTTIISLCFQGYSVAMGVVSGVILVPLYLRHIPSDLYGAWSASGNILVWMTLIDPGLSAVLQQRVATSYGQRDRAAVSGWIVSGLWISIGIALIILLAGMISSFFFAEWMHLPPTVDQAALVQAFRWAVAGGALMVFSYSINAINQGLQSSLAMGLIFVAATLVRLLLVILLLGYGFGLLAIAVPTAIMSLLLVCGNLIYLHIRLWQDSVPLSWKPKRIRELAGLLSFTGMSRGSSILINNMDLFLVARMLGPENVNVLRFTRTGAEVTRTIIERPFAAIQATLPHLLGSGNIDRAREIVLRLLRWAIWAILLSVGGFLVFNGDFVRLWVGMRFYAGAQVNLLLTILFALALLTSLIAGLSFSAGQIRGTSIAGLAHGLIYLPLALIGGYWLGIKGFITASLISLLITQGWYVPTIFVRSFCVTRNQLVRLLWAMLGGTISVTTTAMVFLGRPPVSTRPIFVASVCAFAACYFALLLLLSGEARKEIRDGFAWIRQRFDF